MILSRAHFGLETALETALETTLDAAAFVLMGAAPLLLLVRPPQYAR